mgnify:CR=1 FL=1
MDNLSYQPATGSTDFGPLEETDLNEHYAGMAALVAAIAAAIGSIIYASKHIRHSECLGSRCDQDVVIEQVQPKQRLETSL